MSKPFKKTTVGKVLWWLGDTVKGKTKVGKGLDSVLEIVPLPNPIRYFREAQMQKKLRKMESNQLVQNAAQESGFDFNELLDDSPPWVQPALAFVALIGILVLVGMEIIEPMYLINLLQAFIGG